MSDNATVAGPVAVFGGTFDPIHFGHLRSALELVEELQLKQLRMMPAAMPPHRSAPATSARHRATMVELAVQGHPQLCCDERELQRGTTSYTIDSLTDIRRELGDECSLSLVMGCDAVLDITSWTRWQELLDRAHIIVIARPGWALPDEGEVADWLAVHSVDDYRQLHRQPAGSILVWKLRPLAISSTEIRALLRVGRSARYLLPEPVRDYIEAQKLYCD